MYSNVYLLTGVVGDGWLPCTQQDQMDISSEDELDPEGMGRDVTAELDDVEDHESTTDSCEEHDVLSIQDASDAGVTVVESHVGIMEEPCLALTIGKP